MNRHFQRENSIAFSSSFTCLDGVPFRISPQFKPPPEVRINPGVNLSSSSSTVDEYDFATEEGVLKWADERQRQLVAQQRAEEEKIRQRLDNQASDSDDSTNDEDDILLSSDACEVENTTQNEATNASQPNPAPLLVGISSDILTPTPISAPNSQRHDGQERKSVDVSQFEKVDDPFDMFERQTLNDLEELKSVFATSKSDITAAQTKPARSKQKSPNLYENVEIDSSGQVNGLNTEGGKGKSNESSCDTETVEHSNTDVTEQDVKKKKKNKKKQQWLPPVPPRPSLAAKSPLPPIGGMDSNSTMNSTQTQRLSPLFVETANCDQNGTSGISDVNEISDVYENVHVSADTKTAAYSNSSQQAASSTRPDSFIQNKDVRKTSRDYVNVAPKIVPRESVSNSFMITESKSTVDTVCNANQTDLMYNSSQTSPYVLSQSPTPRPSSKQDLSTEPTASWNKYTPLPDPVIGANSPVSPPRSSSGSSSSSDFASQAEVDPYLRLSREGKTTVDNVVAMGFSRPRAARAVEQIGTDGKEIVEYLCLVNKQIEKGHDPLLSESAVLLCKSNPEKLEIFLSLYKQFQELGFSGERIKEALVKNDLDSERTIDYLTS